MERKLPLLVGFRLLMLVQSIAWPLVKNKILEVHPLQKVAAFSQATSHCLGPTPTLMERWVLAPYG